MHIDDGLAAVKELHQRIERLVAEEFFAIACEQADAFEVQRLEAIFRFGNSGIDVVHRDQAEAAEPLRPLLNQLGRVVIALVRQCRRPSARQELHAGLRNRGDGKLDFMLVHDVERERRRPFRIAADGGPGARVVDRIAIERRNEMQVNVDLAGRHASCP